MRNRARFVTASFSLVLLAGLAMAQPVLIVASTTVGPADTTVGGVSLATAQITVRGTTLTMTEEGLTTSPSRCAEKARRNSERPGVAHVLCLTMRTS